MGPISRLQCLLKAVPLGLFLHESESLLREIIPHRQVLGRSELVALLGRESPRLPRSELDLSVLEVLRSSPDLPRQADVRLSELLQGRCGSVKLKAGQSQKSSERQFPHTRRREPKENS